jgi:hypothetical protein
LVQFLQSLACEFRERNSVQNLLRVFLSPFGVIVAFICTTIGFPSRALFALCLSTVKLHYCDSKFETTETDCSGLRGPTASFSSSF